jgi:hypothetical protein
VASTLAELGEEESRGGVYQTEAEAFGTRVTRVSHEGGGEAAKRNGNPP